jgi:hypothetical protein
MEKGAPGAVSTPLDECRFPAESVLTASILAARLRNLLGLDDQRDRND